MGGVLTKDQAEAVRRFRAAFAPDIHPDVVAFSIVVKAGL